MLKSLVKGFQLGQINLCRGRGASGGGGGGGSDGTSAFARNCVTKEQQLSAALRRALPGATYVSVHDVSGGCGAMYEISVEAAEFSGLGRLAQHRLVTDSLRAEIAAMHGLRIHTAVPKEAQHQHQHNLPPAPPDSTHS